MKESGWALALFYPQRPSSHLLTSPLAMGLLPSLNWVHRCGSQGSGRLCLMAIQLEKNRTGLQQHTYYSSTGLLGISSPGPLADPLTGLASDKPGRILLCTGTLPWLWKQSSAFSTNAVRPTLPPSTTVCKILMAESQVWGGDPLPDSVSSLHAVPRGAVRGAEHRLYWGQQTIGATLSKTAHRWSLISLIYQTSCLHFLR